MGYGIARRIEQISGNQLQLNQRTIYPALLHLEQMSWICSIWACRKTTGAQPGITRLLGPKRNSLPTEEDNWRRASEVIVRILEPSEETT